jgi:hypothetical protein
VASRCGTRRRELSRQSGGAEKQESHWRASAHAYRDKEREERVEEEDRTPALCTLFLAGRGRGER